VLGGAGLRVSADPPPIIGWNLEMLAETGAATSSTMVTWIDTVGLGAGVLLHGILGPITLRAGAGLRIGVARASLSSSADHLLTGWLTEANTAAINLVVRRAFTLELTLELGFSIAFAEASASALTGVSLGTQIAVGFFP
jgi:hypothetical protein